jgi:hypothetical protein
LQFGVDCLAANCGSAKTADYPDMDGDGVDDLVVRRGNRLRGDTAPDGGAPEKIITLFTAGGTCLPRSSR